MLVWCWWCHIWIDTPTAILQSCDSLCLMWIQDGQQALQLRKDTKILGAALKSWCDCQNVANLCLCATSGGRLIKRGRSEQEVPNKDKQKLPKRMLKGREEATNERELDRTTMMHLWGVTRRRNSGVKAVQRVPIPPFPARPYSKAVSSSLMYL